MTTRDGIAAVTFANLFFLRVWWHVLQPTTAYHAGSQYEIFIGCLAFCFNVLTGGLFLWITLSLLRRTRSANVMRIAAATGLLVLLAVVRPGTLEGQFARAAGEGVLLVTVLFCAAVTVLAALWSARVRHFAIAGLLILSPSVIVTFSRAGWSCFHQIRAAAYQPKSNSPWLPVSAGSKRAIWIIFDEMDQRLAFEVRPGHLQLPQLDRFRAEALYATNAFPPPGRFTEIVMPALITGRAVSAIEKGKPNELLLTQGEQNRWFSREDNVFTDAHLAGLNAALVGFYNPYCRIIGQDATSCYSSLHNIETHQSLPHVMWDQWQVTLSRMFKVGSTGLSYSPMAKMERRTFIETYNEVLPPALNAAVDPRLNLVMIHLPVPHPPGIYDRKTGRLTDSGRSSYLDNLALMDVTLGKIRSAMESAGIWDRSTVLISADHSLRCDVHSGQDYWTEDDSKLCHSGVDFRVPFLVKLAGEHSAVVYTRPFNTVTTRTLLTDILRNKVASTASATTWLDRHAADVGTPQAQQQQVR